MQCRVWQSEAVARSLQTMAIPGGSRLLGRGTLTPWCAVCDRRALQGTVHPSETDHASSGSMVLIDDRQILLSYYSACVGQLGSQSHSGCPLRAMNAHVVAASLRYGTVDTALLSQSEGSAPQQAAHEQRASLSHLGQMCHAQLVQSVLPLTDWLLPGKAVGALIAAIVAS